MRAVISTNDKTDSGFQSIPGFENTEYAYLNDRIVWTGAHAITQHPRIVTNVKFPWQANEYVFNHNKLFEGALICKSLFASNQPLVNQANGLMRWLLNQEMTFPLNLSTTRFDDIKRALVANDLPAFTAAAIRVLGLGNGLTPSGDDFVGGILFALAHSPRLAWVSDLPEAKRQIQVAAKGLTNVISAALLDDMIAGNSFGALCDLLIAIDSNDSEEIQASSVNLMRIGASSGSDMLAGLLLALITTTTVPEALQNHNTLHQH